MKVSTLAAAFAGGFVMFLLGFVFYVVVFADYFRDNMVQYPGLMKDPPIFWSIFLFNLVWAYLIALVLDHWAGLSGWAEGAKAGAIIMFLSGLAMNLDFFAFLNMHRSFTPILVHLLVIMVMGAGAGTVIGLVLGYFNKRTAAA